MWIEYHPEGEPEKDCNLMNLGTAAIIYINQLPTYERYNYELRVCLNESECHTVYKGEILQCWAHYELIKEGIQENKQLYDMSRSEPRERDHLAEFISVKCSSMFTSSSKKEHTTLTPLIELLEAYNEFTNTKEEPKEMDADTFKGRMEYEGFEYFHGKYPGICLIGNEEPC